MEVLTNWVRLALAAAVLALAASSSFAEDPPRPLYATEPEVKAAFVFNLTKFVEWPAGTLPRPQDCFVLGVLGDPMLAGNLAHAFADKRLFGRKVEVRRLDDPSRLGDCHLLYLARWATSSLPKALGPTGRRAVLTVGEGSPFLEAGGVVAFQRAGNTLRLSVCPDNAEKVGLRLSSKLLRAVKIVRLDRGGQSR